MQADVGGSETNQVVLNIRGAAKQIELKPSADLCAERLGSRVREGDLRIPERASGCALRWSRLRYQRQFHAAGMAGVVIRIHQHQAGQFYGELLVGLHLGCVEVRYPLTEDLKLLHRWRRDDIRSFHFDHLLPQRFDLAVQLLILLTELIHLLEDAVNARLLRIRGRRKK